MKKIAIIPARGGSKRIPKKNIKDFLGKPIIAYAIEAVKESGLFDEIMVSTDDENIVKIAQQFGAKVPFMRSAKNASDFATTFDVIEEVLNQYEEKFDFACCIYPCNPFLKGEQLEEAFNLLKEKHFDTVFPLIEYTSPIQRSLEINNNTVHFVYPEHELTRSQDLPKRYHDAGQFYFFRPQSILEEKRIVGQKTGGIIISNMEAQDIDNEMDWKLAEIKYQLNKK